MRSAFAGYHPAVEFGFFCVAIGVGMFMIHPVFLAIGASAALVFAVLTGGKGTVKFSLFFLLPMLIAVTVINPLVNHQGRTILLRFSRTYITAESLLYGLLLGLMLAAILLWFSSYNKIMTADKFTYLFGRVMPSASLIFTMVMRFIPNYRIQMKKIADAQKAAGFAESPPGAASQPNAAAPANSRPPASPAKCRKAKAAAAKIRAGAAILSVLFTWALESSVDSADSMRSRGYGLAGRTSFSIYRFDRRDGAAAVFLALMTAVVLAGCLSGACRVEYFPEIVFAEASLLQTASYLAFACICYFPVLAEAKEALVWKLSESKI